MRKDSRIKRTTQLPRGSGPREARLAYMALSQLEIVLRGEPNLIIRFHTMASPHQKKSMLRETDKHSLMMTGGKQIGGPRPGGRHQGGSGTTKSADFFSDSRFRTHVVATTVCATGRCIHTPCRTCSLHLSLRDVQTRTRMAPGVCSAHVISLTSPISCFIRHPSCSRTVTSSPRSRLYLPCRTVPDPKARVKRTSARAARNLATWPIPRTPHPWHDGKNVFGWGGPPFHL